VTVSLSATQSPGLGFFGLRRSRHSEFCAFEFWVLLRWHPRFVFGFLTLPLCGAAVTFFAAAKKVTKESGF
jgi:hypothetical protein